MDPNGIQLVGIGAALIVVLKLFDVLIRWMLSRISASEVSTEARIERLEARVATLEQQVSRERSLKHQALQDSSAYLGTIHVIDNLVNLLRDGTMEQEAFLPAVRELTASALQRGRRREQDTGVL